MSKSKNKRNSTDYRRYLKGTKPKSTEKLAESHLVNLEKANAELCSFWEDYCLFLAREREKRLDDIVTALFEARSPTYNQESLSRIVSGNFTNNPLCTLGSIRRPPGGRFNFGLISSALKDFQCLYLANDFETAFFECYHHEYDEAVGEGELSPEEIALTEPGSFLHCKLNVQLENVLDLRNDESLEEFTQIISQIKSPPHLEQRAEELKLGTLTTVDSVERLRLALFQSNYKQWGTWISQPANSQWFGHYSRMAGLQALIYPSCRNNAPNSFNLAIYPENLKNSQSHIKIADQVQHIDSTHFEMNANNYWLFTSDDNNSNQH